MELFLVLVRLFLQRNPLKILRIAMLKEAFDKVKDQMGPCGIVCAMCDLGNGTVAEIALKLKQYLQMYGVSSWASQVQGGSDINFNYLDKRDTKGTAPGRIATAQRLDILEKQTFFIL